MYYRSKKIIIISILAALFIVTASLNGYAAVISTKNDEKFRNSPMGENSAVMGTSNSFSGAFPSAIAVSDSNPFYALIATPLAIYYEDDGEQKVIPLYVKNFDSPSEAVERAEDQIGLYADYIISDIYPPKETSLVVASSFWETSSSVLVIKNDMNGYNLGVTATPLASYLNMPIVVTDDIDSDSMVMDVLNSLNVTHVYICGDIDTINYNKTIFNTNEEIIDKCLEVIKNKLNHTVNYITMANPLDVSSPELLDKTVYEFNGTLSSGVLIPTQFINSNIKKNGMPVHEFAIPNDYKYTLLKIDIENFNSEHVDTLGDRLFIMVNDPDSNRIIYASTCGGQPVLDNQGRIVKDKLHFETTIYNGTGNYTLQIYGQLFASKEGRYSAKVTLEKIENPYVPLMPGLSSIASYLTAYHKGIVFANTSFAFAANDEILYNNHTCPGVSQPGTNPNLIVPSNKHTLKIHDELNNLLGKIANISASNILELRNHYKDEPIYLAIAADPTMIPMYFYYNPDGRSDNPTAYMMGFAVPSDFIYADIDVSNSDPENDTYSYWPFMENIVARVTGWDAQDCSALIARTIFYDKIIDEMGDWKNNALIQTGCGLEFQNLPIVTRLGKLLGRITNSGRDEPTKFPTGESSFINLRLQKDMEAGGYNAKSTMWLQSQREGFSSQDLKEIKKLGLMNRLMFPAKLIELLSSKEKVTGGQDQLSSNLIFAFAHGNYNIYEFGDILLDSRGFPGLTTLARIYPKLRSSLSAKGTFDIRNVQNMKYGPSVIYVESCITGRTDGLSAKNVLSQAYIHAGVNAYIGSTRVTADPGYLDPRPLPKGWGIGVLGLIKATIDLKLKGKYPELHFGAVIAEDFINELNNDVTTGLALRNAKNAYLPKDANSTFLWTPPLTLSSGNPEIDKEILSEIQKDSIGGNDRTRTLDKKYVALHEFQLYGDPAFNPYQTVNEGGK
jgi:hypothetical protein